MISRVPISKAANPAFFGVPSLKINWGNEGLLLCSPSIDITVFLQSCLYESINIAIKNAYLETINSSKLRKDLILKDLFKHCKICHFKNSGDASKS